ncbi:DUF3086 domain-containing protein [Kamptonema formosum]|uniref:DUF3086 domain-containing protein n=1 Tax=Kamptonema formosum TaxID=331992 RepID=UPI00047658BB|nr:DUF3086 domain-containing protein [Oscillatoria sp. PCC 10802]
MSSDETQTPEQQQQAAESVAKPAPPEPAPPPPTPPAPPEKQSVPVELSAPPTPPAPPEQQSAPVELSAPPTPPAPPEQQSAPVGLSAPPAPPAPPEKPAVPVQPPADATERDAAALAQRVVSLLCQEAELKEQIAQLQASRAQLLQLQAETQAALGRLVQEGLSELEQRKQALQISVEQLERRQERIRQEMRTTFAGVSQDLAIRVQGFKDYLVGSLQDLVSATEQLELAPPAQPPQKQTAATAKEPKAEQKPSAPRFAEQSFQEQTKQIRRLLDQYRNMPDYYGPPWQLRRTFEPIHAERVSNWFFTQGGRGALRTMGSRLQNILISSAAISVLRSIYGNRLRTLVLAATPERLGEWRRGLQDCLGITRTDFGPERGAVLFEAAEPLVQKADRLLKDGLMPLIVIDETEDQINLSLLQFPLWLAFAPDPQTMAVREI